MKTILSVAVLVWIALLSHPTLYAQAMLSPTANFTLRDDAPISGTADYMDAVPDGDGFDGYLDINSKYQEDRVYVEFNLALRPSSWSSTALRFSTAFLGANFPPSSIRLSYYTGNGSADLSDWTMPTTTLAMFPGITGVAGQTFTVDVTSLASSFGGSGFLGFRFDLVDPALNQKGLDASSIVLTQVPEPSITLLGFLGLGVALRKYCGTSVSKRSLR